MWFITMKKIKNKNGRLLLIFLPRNFTSKWELVLSSHRIMLIRRGFILKPAERRHILLKKFFSDNHWKFESFHFFTFETSFCKMEGSASKTGKPLFTGMNYDWEHNISIQSCLCQKPMFRQIEWKVKNGPITKNTVLSLTTWFFLKI